MKRKAIANIQQSCSDSPWFANPMDGVFGTDNGHLMSQGDELKSRVGAMPELVTYRCEACGHVETIEAQPKEQR
jgi:hypothetical protein